ncbi:MAG: PP2C family protein-serine/threonine phosphatase [Microscillaceae bacterium]|nr:PP2C family protein-serine/threonine phosphatase [Microscillaceae bacterium]
MKTKKLVRRQINQEAFKKEMEIAQKVQSLLFPKKLPQTPHFHIKATYFPHDLIGGDYYDYISLPDNKFIICIADVSGKGVPAALLMSNFQASLRTLARQTEDLLQIVEELNHTIYENAQGEHFITLFLALYNPAQATLQYINAGHNPAYFYDQQKAEARLLNKGTTVLGIWSPLPFLEKETLMELNGFFLFAYTDGVTEVVNIEEEQFGIDRLLAFLKSRRQTELSEMHGHLITRINNFKKNQPFPDDITLLSCRVMPQS